MKWNAPPKKNDHGHFPVITHTHSSPYVISFIDTGWQRGPFHLFLSGWNIPAVDDAAVSTTQTVTLMSKEVSAIPDPTGKSSKPHHWMAKGLVDFTPKTSEAQLEGGLHSTASIARKYLHLH